MKSVIPSSIRLCRRNVGSLRFSVRPFSESRGGHDHSHSHEHNSQCNHSHPHGHDHSHSHDHIHKQPEEKLLAGIKFQYYQHLVEHLSPYMTKVFQPNLVQATKTTVLIELPFNSLLVGNPQIPCLHGGAVATMMDHTGGFAAWAALDDPKQRVNTADLRIDYLLPAPCELLLFEATILHKSKKLIRTDINCYDRVTSALSVDPATQHKVINVDAYKSKRLVATARGLFNIYTTTSDLNTVMEKVLKVRQAKKESDKQSQLLFSYDPINQGMRHQ